MSILWKKCKGLFSPIIYCKQQKQQIVFDENGNEIEIKKFRPGILHYKYNSDWFDVTLDERDFLSNGIIEHDIFESELDGDIVELNFRHFIVRKGHTITTSKRCKGLIIKVSEMLFNVGTISMTARGANAEGRYVGIDYLNKTVNISETAEENPFEDLLNYTIISPVGGLGIAGANGGVGINGACGAGGGAKYKSSGGNGTSFSGGAGGGGGFGVTTSYTSGTNGSPNGGIGGTNYNYQIVQAGSGAGNPGGLCYQTSMTNWNKNFQTGTIYNGKDGTGGLLIIFASTIYNIGKIQCNGMNGGSGQVVNGRGSGYGGGGSGGGAIHTYYKYLTNHGLIEAKGGTGSGTNPGYAGGNGTVNLVNLKEALSLT